MRDVISSLQDRRSFSKRHAFFGHAINVGNHEELLSALTAGIILFFWFAETCRDNFYTRQRLSSSG